MTKAPNTPHSLGASLLRLGRKVEGQREIEVFEQMQAASRLREDREWDLRLIRQAASTSLDKGDIEDVAVQLRKVIPLAPIDAVSCRYTRTVEFDAFGLCTSTS